MKNIVCRDNFWQFFEKNITFLAVFWHSNANFPEGQVTSLRYWEKQRRRVWWFLRRFNNICTPGLVEHIWSVCQVSWVCCHSTLTLIDLDNTSTWPSFYRIWRREEIIQLVVWFLGGDCLIVWLIECLIGWVFDWLSVWFIDWLIDWLVWHKAVSAVKALLVIWRN